MHEQSITCIHLRRSQTQPGWVCLDPRTGRKYSTVHVDFVEDCLPGITLDADDNEQVVPPFSRDYDPNARLAPMQVPAYVIMFGASCVCYASKKQQCIAMSSTEAEIIAASQAALEIVYLRTLITEMGIELDGPTVLLVDNSGAVELSKHQKACHRSRHVKRRYLKVRELVAEGEIVVEWVDTKENPADLLSKGTIEPAQFDVLKQKIMSGARAAAATDDDVAAGALACVECSPPATCEHRWRDWDGQTCNVDDCGGQLLLCTRCHSIRCRACGWRSHLDDEVSDAGRSPPATCPHNWQSWAQTTHDENDCGGAILLCTRCHRMKCSRCGWRSHLNDEWQG